MKQISPSKLKHNPSGHQMWLAGTSPIYNWLVVLTILKNISQWEGLSHILWKIQNVPNHQPDNMSS